MRLGLPEPNERITLNGNRFHEPWFRFFRQLADAIDELSGKEYTVTTLPTGVKVGRRAFVTDATSTTFHTIVAGSGSNRVPVTYDGTNWRIG